LYWQKSAALPESMELRLLNSAGKRVATWERPIAGAAAYPPQAWAQGEIVRAQVDLFLSDVLPGAYRLEVVVGDDTVETLQKIKITEK